MYDKDVLAKRNEYEAPLFIYWNCQGEKDDMKVFLIPPKNSNWRNQYVSKIV